MVKETGCGFSLRSLPTGTSSVISALFTQIWTSVAAGDSKLRHQPSIRSVTRLPNSLKFLTPGHGSAKHVFSEKIVIVTDYVLDSAPEESNFSQEQLALFVLLRSDFHVAYYSPESFQKLCHNTRRVCSHAKATSNINSLSLHRLALPLCLLIALATSHGAHEVGPHSRTDRKPVRDQSNRRRPGKVSFFPVLWRMFDLFFSWGGGGGLPFNLFGDQLSTFWATSCRSFANYFSLVAHGELPTGYFKH